MNIDNSSKPAGWYADQQAYGRLRFWTGTEWKSETRYVATAGAATSPPATLASGPPRRDWIANVAIGLVLAVGGLIVGFTPTPDSVGGSPFSPFTYFQERECASYFCEPSEVRLPDANTATFPGLAVAAGIMFVLIGIVLYIKRE